MKTTLKLALFSGIVSTCIAPTTHASLTSTAILNFDSPEYDINGQVISGSNFGVDFTGDGTIELIERTGLTMNDGLKLGATQTATPISPGIDQPWNFFGNQGVHTTFSDISILSDDGLGNVELDFSGWAINWNGIDVGLGGTSWGSNPDGVAQMTCANDCSDGDSFSIFYTATVTDVSTGFAGIRYRLGFDSNTLAFAALAISEPTIGPIEDLGIIATGTISSVPIPAAAWLFGSGLLSLIGVARRNKNTL